MADKIKVPLQYGYFEGGEIIMSSFGLLVFAILSICIAVAPVFCGEYQAGTDAVVLAGRFGKTKLITAKITASFLFGLVLDAFSMRAISYAILTVIMIPFAKRGFQKHQVAG